MKAKDIIAFLQTFDPEVDVSVAVFDCSEGVSLYHIESAEADEFDSLRFPRLDINTGCAHQLHDGPGR